MLTAEPDVVIDVAMSFFAVRAALRDQPFCARTVVFEPPAMSAYLFCARYYQYAQRVQCYAYVLYDEIL